MKQTISLILLFVSTAAIHTHQEDAALVTHELNDQEAALVERKRVELSTDQEEIDALIDEGIAAIGKEIAPEVGIIRYTFTLYKDHEKNTFLWPNLVTKTLMAASRAQLSGESPLALLQEVCQALLQEVDRGQDHGIMGEVAISLSDGIPSEDCCGGACQCVARYNGNCPCSLDQGTRSRCCGPDMTDNDEVTMTDEDDMDTSEDDQVEIADQEGMVEISLDVE
jgi:hypothetical protein